MPSIWILLKQEEEGGGEKATDEQSYGQIVTDNVPTPNF